MPDKIGIGLASYGMSGRVFHAPIIAHHEGFRLVRIVERSTDEAISRYPGAAISRSFEELLTDPSIEVVVVNTPDQTHYEFAKRCLEAGRHVVVEKPFTQSVKEANDLIRLARHHRRILTVFQNRRWDGDFLTIREVIDRKLLGRLVDFESHFDRYRNFIQEGTWKEKRSSGSDLLFNLGSHMIDQAIVLFGIPSAVTAHIKTIRPGGEVSDWYELRLHYDDVNVVTKASYLVREPGPRYTLHGTNGSFVKFGIDPQEEALKQGGVPGGPEWGKEAQEWWGQINTDVNGKHTRATVETKAGNYSAFYDNLSAAITGGSTLAVTPYEALHVIRIIEAARKSNAERRTVDLKEVEGN
jgi:predicted dehydrogenase